MLNKTIIAAIIGTVVSLPAGAAVVINEVLFRQSIGGVNNNEFVELYNNGSVSVDISNWRLTDEELGGVTPFNYTFPAGTVLDPNQYAVIWIGAIAAPSGAQFEVALGITPKLRNGGDNVTLYDNTGVGVDYMAYGTGAAAVDPPPAGVSWDASFNADLTPSARGRSVSLVPNGVDSNTSACWEQTADATNPNSGFCPGYLLSVDRDPVLTASPAQSNNFSADISVVKTENIASNSYTPGATTNYSITVTNDGPDDVNGATFTDQLPNGVSFNGAVACLPASGCSLPAPNPPAGQTLNMQIDIAAGTSLVVTIPVLYSSDPADY
ncbi:lamin tail domain-containing protein [Kangiella sp. TOML190]|uniref:lamin tail domain-containing protein n=1 Tax=Kangiella sp. TOML190 TaxID=2931351 RepID=UPI00203E68FA|nr:lamin tail domain-containing protein [Kangiella sp. TOML190]